MGNRMHKLALFKLLIILCFSRTQVPPAKMLMIQVTRGVEIIFHHKQETLLGTKHDKDLKESIFSSSYHTDYSFVNEGEFMIIQYSGDIEAV